MDNEKLEVGFNAPGVELIQKAVTALDQLQATMAKLGTGAAGSSLKNVQLQVETMQASMTTGFKEIEARIDKFTEKVKQASQTSTNYAQQRLAASQAALAAERAAAAESERIAAQAAAAQQARNQQNTAYAAQRLAATQANLAAERAAALESEKIASQLAAAQQARNQQAAGYAQQRLAASQAALAAERAAQTQAAVIAKATAEAEVAAQAQRLNNNQDYAAQRHAQNQARLAQQRGSDSSELADARRMLEAEKALQAERLSNNQRYAQQRLAQSQAQRAAELSAATEAASAAERQRNLNTGFLASSPRAQLSTAREAQIYGSLGGDVAAKYGTSAAAIAANTVEYKKLEQAAKASAGSVQHHNEAMREGHAFARGLSGALGSLWITYGSLAPLLAGAALAGSLRKVYEAGKEVEHQLTFVKALSGTPVNLDKFLAISEGTVMSVKSAAEGMRALSQNGLDARRSLEALPTVLNLATIGEMGVADAALSATGVLTAFNLELSELGRVADVFAKTAASSNTSVASMTESMKTASTASSLYGVSLEQTAASIGIMAKLNITGSAAGTAFRNALKDLYEPTKKQADALKMVGISTRDANDGLKDYVQLLSELRDKTASMSEGARSDFLTEISSERGSKAMAAALSNWDQFNKMLDESANAVDFNRKAVLELENTVDGASKRMANSFDSTFTRAFTEASPIVQKLLTEVGDIGRSKGLLNFLSSAAEGVANLTRFFIEHADTITDLLMVYGGLKILNYLWASYTTLASSMGTVTVAGTAQAASFRVLSTIKAAYAPQVAATALAVQGEAAAMVQATAASGALATAQMALAGTFRVVMASLGPIMLAVTAVVTVYELFINRASDTDKALMRHSNTLDVINEDLDRQIERLEKRNRLWDPKTMTYREESKTAEASAAIMRARENVTEAEFAVERAILDNRSAFIVTLRQNELDKRRKALEEALIKEDGIKKKAASTEAANAEETFRAQVDSQLKILRDFRAKADERSTYENGKKLPEGQGKLIAKPEQIPFYMAAEDLIADTMAAKLANDRKKFEQVKVDFEKLRSDMNAVGDRFAKPEDENDRDAYQAALAKDAAAASSFAKVIEGDLARARSAYAQGTIGDIQLIEKESLAYKQAAQVKADAAKSAAAIALAAGNKADFERYAAQQDAAATEYTQAELTRQQRLKDNNARIEQEITKSLIDTLNARGEYRRAAELEAEQAFGLVAKRMQADIADALEAGDINTPAFELMIKQAAQIQAKIKAKVAEGATKEVEATARGITTEVSTITNGMAEGIAVLNERASAGVGIFDQWGLTNLNEKLQTATLPALEALRIKALAIADKDVGAKVLSAIDLQIAKTGKQIGELERKLTSGMFKELARNIDAMGESFRNVAVAVDGVGNAIDKLQRLDQLQAQGQKVAAQDRIGAYGDIAAAASKAFDEQTGGYQTLNGIAKVFHAAQLAMNVSQMAQMAVMAVMNQASKGDPWTAWARMAAMAAAMGALGYAVGGGFSSSSGGGISAEQMQKQQGTGSVFGDASAKSESVMRSIEILERNSDRLLPVNQGMLSALKNIEASMAGLTNLVVRTPGVIEGSNLGIAEGTISKSTGSSMASGAALGATAGTYIFPGIGTIIGGVIGGALGAMKSIWGKTKQSIVDSGLQFGGPLTDLQAGLGYSQYASVDTTKSTFFSLSKKTSNSVVTEGLNRELSDQFGLIFKNLEVALKTASGSLGSSANEVETILNNFSLASTTVSLKGLSGQALSDALNSVISKSMDEIATAALPGLDAFRRVGEGYAETVMRVASSVEVAGMQLERFGLTAVKFGDITNKQGDVAAEIVRESIVRTEKIRVTLTGTEAIDANLVTVERYKVALTGVGQIMQGMTGTAEELANTYQELLDIRTQMTKVGLSESDLGLSIIKGAGGSSNLSSGLKDFFENFYTEAERAKAESDALAKQFAALGVAMPTSREKFRELVLSTGTSTEATAKLTGQLLNLAGAFASVSEATSNVITATESMVAASDKKDRLAASRAKDLADETIRKASEESFKTLTESVKTGLQGLLRAGKASAAVDSVMSITKLSSAQYTNADGSFNAGGFNLANSYAKAKISKDLINQASADAINIENVSGVISRLMSNILDEDLKNNLIQNAAQQVKLPAGGLINQAVRSLLESSVEKMQLENMIPDGQGIASVKAARRRLNFVSYDQGMMGDGIGADVNAYGESMRQLGWLLSKGKITQEEYNAAVASTNLLIGNSIDLVGDQAAQLERVNKAQESLRQAGLDSISYYFGEIGKSVAQLAVAAEEAKTPLALTVQSIGRLASLADVMSGSVSAATYNDANTDNLSVVNADIVAKAAAIAASVMTTADAAAAAKTLAEKQSFSGVGGTELRNISMIMDGLKQYDSISFETTFMKLNDALAKGVVTQAQYQDIFQQSLAKYKGEDVLSAAATVTAQLTNNMEKLRDAMGSFADEILIDKSKTTLSPAATVAETMRQYEVARAVAMSAPDDSSISRYRDVANQLLDVNKYSSQAEYNAVFGKIYGDARNMEDLGALNAGRSREQEIIDQLADANERLDGLQEALLAALAQIAKNTKDTVTGINVSNLP